MGDKKVTSLKQKKIAKSLEANEMQMDVSYALTDEEIQAVIMQDEAELNGYLNKFQATSATLPDSSQVEEEDEDEEEETITLDFDNGTAYEKLGEGVAVRDSDGSVSLIDDPSIIEQLKQAVLESAEPLKPTNQQRYEDLVTERFVSKAIASLIDKLNDSMANAGAAVKIPGGIGDGLSQQLVDVVYKQKEELRRAYTNYPRLGAVKYENIPSWALPYIDEYVSDAINTMLDFVERD